MSLVLNNIRESQLKNVLHKVMEGIRITEDDALALYNSNEILQIGAIADIARINRLNEFQKDYAYFVNNHHINLTNVCKGTCKFCAYRKDEYDSDAYFMQPDELEAYLIEAVSKEVKELHIVSAINPKADLSYYKKVFSICKNNLPDAHIQALTAVEIDYLAELESKSVAEILLELKKSGLGSIPGGGAEIFDQNIRKMVCPDKISGERWLDIMKIAHEYNIFSNATMLSGIGESYEHRVEHISKIRKLQDQTGGFLTFIPLVCHYENTELNPVLNNTGIDNIKDLAVSRIFLDNIPHIKAFWIQLGIRMAQISLAFGVDDLDGVVVKEKISSSAGANSDFQMTKETMISLIKSAGRIPVERDTVYNVIEVYK